MTIGKRIKLIRNENKMTLEKFGAYLKISPQSVSKLERGVSNPSDQTVFLLCQKFHINEEWLRTGEGEPRQATYQDALWDIVQARGLDHADYALIAGIMEMPAETRKAIISAILDIADRIKRGVPLSAVPTTDQKQETDEDRHERHKREADAEAVEVFNRIREGNLDEKRANESGASGETDSGSGTSIA